MTILVSLGCNCHPAWWLRKLNLRGPAMPFDWLLSKPHLGLDFAVTVQDNGFDGWLDGLSVNARGHPVSSRYPAIELFHHHDLVADDPELRAAEHKRLTLRAADFGVTVARGGVDFLYCFPLRDKLPQPAELQAFERSVDRALASWPSATLHVYFLSDAPGLLGRPLLKTRDRLVEHAYFRDRNIDRNWGTEPSFLRAITAEVSAVDTPR